MKTRDSSSSPASGGSSKPSGGSSFSSRSTKRSMPSGDRSVGRVRHRCDRLGPGPGSPARSGPDAACPQVTPLRGSPCRATTRSRRSYVAAGRPRGYGAETIRARHGRTALHNGRRPARNMPAMSTFAVVAHRVTPDQHASRGRSAPGPGADATRPRRRRARPPRHPAVARRRRARPLGARPARRARRDGAERPPHARRRARQARNRRGAVRAGVPHPRTVHVAPWLPSCRSSSRRSSSSRASAPGARTSIRCDDAGRRSTPRSPSSQTRPWFEATGAIAQKLVAPRGYDLRHRRRRRQVVGAVRRVAAPGEWRTNVALGARREPVAPADDACAIALAAAAAIGGDLVGIDLLPADVGTWVVLEVNGAVDFNSTYSLGEDVSRRARRARGATRPSVRVEPAA